MHAGGSEWRRKGRVRAAGVSGRERIPGLASAFAKQNGDSSLLRRAGEQTIHLMKDRDIHGNVFSFAGRTEIHQPSFGAARVHHGDELKNAKSPARMGVNSLLGLNHS